MGSFFRGAGEAFIAEVVVDEASPSAILPFEAERENFFFSTYGEA